MAKLECISAYWHLDKDGMLIKSYDDVPDRYTDDEGNPVSDRVIYDVEEDIVGELLASGCFKRV